MGIVKKFYDSLADGKIVGFKCRDCGTYVFPPKSVCPKCLGRNLEWTTISGEGKVIYFSTSMMPAPPFRDYTPYAYGLVKLKEGPLFYGMITGIDVSDTSKIRETFKRLPLDVRAEIKKIAEVNVITFSVK